MEAETDTAPDSGAGIPAQTAKLEVVARAALPRFGLDPDASLRLVHYRENAVFRVDASGESHPWVLRVHRLGYRTPAEIRSEIAWIEALAADGVATARVRRTVDGEVVESVRVSALPEPRCVSVGAWIDGKALADDDSSATYALVGRSAALIQRHGRVWRPPPWFTRPVWDFDRLAGPKALWGNYADLARLAPSQLPLLDRAAAAVRRRLERFGQSGDRFGLTHADLMPDNVLVSGEIAHVIDFDDCGHAWYLYDLATLLAVRGADPDRERVRDAWVDGYRTVSLLPDEHLPALEWLIMARLLLGLGWMHTRRETELAQLLTDTVVDMACVHAESVLAAE
jgi:Ser/Thr protein kinase RdoA (MazF antagonist)